MKRVTLKNFVISKTAFTVKKQLKSQAPGCPIQSFPPPTSQSIKKGKRVVEFMLTAHAYYWVIGLKLAHSCIESDSLEK